ncbi:MAG: ribulose-phosphate 3-epimerase [Actinomycetota bacterium]|nr:ribulose-phosphate 3-epimerase [Actinomycetota bacterium]MDI6822167.1 ribulose-phosphate 3-epimerase [Actinomycetota bacterium]
MVKRVKIAPSILSANFACLGEQVKRAEEAGADYIHIDVMDGHFVPNISIGPSAISAIKRYANIPFDVHLMIENPEFFIEDFIEAGANLLSVHFEACTHLHRVIQRVKTYSNLGVGVALNPATTLTNLINILPEIHFVVIMSVNPGFEGQEFIPQTLEKIRLLKNMIEERNPSVAIEVDGGVSQKNALDIVKAGADILVAGSAIFNHIDIGEAIRNLRKVISPACRQTGLPKL